ncbi:hypothetical protein [Nostoc sp. MG11]|uniref:hypothetical protein n=1 Tax=Nostoc sp. MG11 TaxID=2721166 RepID=UPI001867D9C8|nr:hypothetical protein [Nostoc sp. MG11]
MKLATRQAMMRKFAQPIALMQQTKNFSLSFLYGDNLLDFCKKSMPYRLGLICFSVIGLYSCGMTSSGSSGILPLKNGTNVTPIREIKPKQNNQAIVYIQGKVEKQAPLMKQQAYQINDSTGKIWVVTNQTGLEQGAQVVIKGKVRYQSIPLAGKELGEVYLEEE